MLCPFKFRSDVKIRISTKQIISFYKSKEIYSQKNTIPQVFKQIDNRTKKKNRSDDDRLLKQPLYCYLDEVIENLKSHLTTNE